MTELCEKCLTNGSEDPEDFCEDCLETWVADQCLSSDDWDCPSWDDKAYQDMQREGYDG